MNWGFIVSNFIGLGLILIFTKLYLSNGKFQIDESNPEKDIYRICINKFDKLKAAMNEIGVTGMTVSNVMGCGMQKGASEYYRGIPVEVSLLPKIKVETVISKVSVDDVVEAARKVLYTGHIGDGKIFISDVTGVVKIRTGETGYDALQNDK